MVPEDVVMSNFAFPVNMGNSGSKMQPWLFGQMV
jgi:hypothetical protein